MTHAEIMVGLYRKKAEKIELDKKSNEEVGKIIIKETKRQNL